MSCVVLCWRFPGLDETSGTSATPVWSHSADTFPISYKRDAVLLSSSDRHVSMLESVEATYTSFFLNPSPYTLTLWPYRSLLKLLPTQRSTLLPQVITLADFDEYRRYAAGRSGWPLSGLFKPFRLHRRSCESY